MGEETVRAAAKADIFWAERGREGGSESGMSKSGLHGWEDQLKDEDEVNRF